MSGLFTSYEEDFNDSLRLARETLNALRQSYSVARGDGKSKLPPNRSQMNQTVQQCLSHMRDVLTSMTYECNDLESTAAAAAKRRVEECKRTVMELEKEATKARHESREADRMDLLSTGADIPLDADTQRQRMQMLDNSEKLREGTDTLRRAEAFLHQTSEVGVEVLTGVRKQTETMRHFRATAHDVDEEVAESRRVIGSMQRTALKQKMYMIGIILLLVLAIIAIFALR